MLVGDGAQQVALECDGDRFHGVDQIQDDMIRQAILERAGWRFIRVRGTRFFRNPDGTMEWLLTELARLGVGASSESASVARGDAASTAFREAVVRRAHEIMRDQQWLPPPGASAPAAQPGE